MSGDDDNDARTPPLEHALASVLSFHVAFDVPIGARPAFPPNERRVLRMELIDEELAELQESEDHNDLVGVALLRVVLRLELEAGERRREVTDLIARLNGERDRAREEAVAAREAKIDAREREVELERRRLAETWRDLCQFADGRRYDSRADERVGHVEVSALYARIRARAARGLAATARHALDACEALSREAETAAREVAVDPGGM